MVYDYNICLLKTILKKKYQYLERERGKNAQVLGEKLSGIHTDKQGFTASDVSLKKIG